MNNYMKKIIKENNGGFHNGGHYHDMKFATLKLINAIIEAIKNTSLYKLDMVQNVLSHSVFITDEEGDMKEVMREKEKEVKAHLVDWYLQKEERMERFPGLITNFAQLNKSGHEIKDVSVEFVTLMYRHCWKNKLASENKIRGGPALTQAVNELFHDYQDGKITKEKYMSEVAEKYKKHD